MQEVYYQTNPCYLHRKIAGEDILISLGGNVANFNGYVSLNPTSSFLWDALATPKNLEQLVQALQTEFSVEYSVAKADVQEFLAELLEKGMAREVADDTP